jgi:hypothetical protein
MQAAGMMLVAGIGGALITTSFVLLHIYAGHRRNAS